MAVQSIVQQHPAFLPRKGAKMKAGEAIQWCLQNPAKGAERHAINLEPCPATVTLPAKAAVICRREADRPIGQRPETIGTMLQVWGIARKGQQPDFEQ